ncbi:hypothetical protein D0T25_28370 [Duganella sp. BJB488]|nr:hypothetical protein D0T25_28370 [Duganella sp. BJB488]
MAYYLIFNDKIQTVPIPNLSRLLPLLTLALSLSHSALADNWAEVTDNDLKILPGSPLDFSKLLTPGPAGAQGRIVKGPLGNLVFELQPEKKAQLNCGSLVWGPVTGGYPDHKTADTYVEQLKLHGYNLIRFHFVDNALMSGRVKTNDFDPTQLDNFYYFLYALKNAGIYWVMDMLTSDNGTIGDIRERWLNTYDLKFGVYTDEEAKKSWRSGVQALYNSINPYTKQSTLSDPALVAVVLVNEGGLNFLSQLNKQTFRPELQAPFNQFLKARYGTQANLKQAWSSTGQDALQQSESLDNNTIALPSGLRVSSSRMTAFQSFLTQLEGQTAEWMTAYVRGLGFQGLVTSLDNWYSLQASRSRAPLDLVDFHGYFNEVGTFQPGLTTSQKSATAAPQDPNFYITNMTTARHAGKPFSITEYGQVFFNQYRYEASAMVPAIAALQGWDFACMHGEGPIDLSLSQTAKHKTSIQPYSPGMDPVLRAGETLSALLFLRGDVSPSKNRVTVKYDAGTEYSPSSGVYAMSPDLRVLGLITGLEIQYGDGELPPVAGIRQVVRQESGVFPGTRVDALRTVGILPSKASNQNISNAWNDVYQSDTGELIFDKPNQRFTVKTARTEAITSAQALDNTAIGALKITNLDSPALLSASTLQDGDLEHSESILLIFATDAMNTDMSFEDPTPTIEPRSKLKNPGTMPVLIRQGVAKATLSLSHKTPMRLVRLDLKGNRQAPVAISGTPTQTGTDWSFKLDNVVPGLGPTTFFLLEKAPAM